MALFLFSYFAAESPVIEDCQHATHLLALVLVSPALAPGLVAVVARVPAVPPVARWPGGLELVSRPQLSALATRTVTTKYTFLDCQSRHVQY